MPNSSMLNPLLAPFREDPNVFCSKAAVTDHQVVDGIHHMFCASGYAPLGLIGIDHDDGRVMLRGRVPTYYLKQLAQSMASSFPGVKSVDNNIEVACLR